MLHKVCTRELYLKILFIYDVPVYVDSAPVGDVAVLAADADSALDQDPLRPSLTWWEFCLVWDGVALVVYL